MSEIPLDELVKQKYEAQLKLQALQYEERLNSLRKTSRDLENMTRTHNNNVKQVKETIETIKDKTHEIFEKLKCENYMSIDRESGIYLKNIFEGGFNILNVKSTYDQIRETNDEVSDPFLLAANKTLQRHQECLIAAANLSSISRERKYSIEEKSTSFQSDDTIVTIGSDHVYASSPLER